LLRVKKVSVKERSIKLLDVVALLNDKLEDGVSSGQVGTVVEVLAPDVFEVEFLDSDGHTIVLAELHRDDLLPLRREREITVKNPPPLQTAVLNDG
jgi:hypothetical protein